MRERWFAGTRALGKTIVVPYTFQSKLSGIGDTAFHDVVWYRRTFDRPERLAGAARAAEFRRRRLRVRSSGSTARPRDAHRGGHSSFVLDITDRLKAGDNVVVVRVYDPATDLHDSARQAVLEAEVGDHLLHAHDRAVAAGVDRSRGQPTRIGRLRITPDVDKSQARIEADLVPAVQQTPGTAEPPALSAAPDGNARRRGAGLAGGQRARHPGRGRAIAERASACGGPIVPRSTT